MKTITEIKQTLRGLAKDEKILWLQQELNNRVASRSSKPLRGTPPEQFERLQQFESNIQPLTKTETNDQSDKNMEVVTDEELETLLDEIKSNHEAYESTTKEQKLIPFMYDRDLNWYFNVKNIPAQQNLVMPTYDYFEEGPGKEFFDPLDFFNLVKKQVDDLSSTLEKPFDILNNLNAIPLSERHKHILFGFILKWHGGYPVRNTDEQYNTVLKLVEKQFLAYPEHTAEHEFCCSDSQTQAHLTELAAHLSAQMPGVKVLRPDESKSEKREFHESHYHHKISMDFEGLPKYVIQKGIIWKFEAKTFRKELEYDEWFSGVKQFFGSIPQEQKIKCLSKAIEYGRKVYEFHLNNECNNPSNCQLNESWERRLALAQSLLSSLQPNESKDHQHRAPLALNEQVLSKIDFLRLINVLYELRAFKTQDGLLPDKKTVVEMFGKFLGKDFGNFHPDLNKGFEKSEETNTKIFDKLRDKAMELWSQKNSR